MLDDSNFNEAVEFDLINLDYVDYSEALTRLAMREKLCKTLRNKIGVGNKESERLEAERKAKEEAERARLEKERMEKAEAERLAKEVAEKKRLEGERKVEEERRKAEQERIAAEKKQNNARQETTNSFNGHEYIDLGLPSGTLWATCNVGANESEDYGDYYSWDEGKTAIANWGNGWGMPSKEQWEELKENTRSTWTTRNGVNGKLFTSKKNRQTLFLPAGGYRWSGEFNDVGSSGNYWSSSLGTSGPNYAWYFYFYSSNYDVYYNGRDYGLSVRAVRSAHQN